MSKVGNEETLTETAMKMANDLNMLIESGALTKEQELIAKGIIKSSKNILVLREELDIGMANLKIEADYVKETSKALCALIGYKQPEAEKEQEDVFKFPFYTKSDDNLKN